MVVLLSYYSKRSSRLTNFSVCFRAVPSDFRIHWIAFLVRFSGDPSSSTSSVLRVKKCALDGLRLTSRIAWFLAVPYHHVGLSLFSNASIQPGQFFSIIYDLGSFWKVPYALDSSVSSQWLCRTFNNINPVRGGKLQKANCGRQKVSGMRFAASFLIAFWFLVTFKSHNYGHVQYIWRALCFMCVRDKVLLLLLFFNFLCGRNWNIASNVLFSGYALRSHVKLPAS